MRRRHGAVHYRSALDSSDARDEALVAIHLLAGLIEKIFSPMGSRSYYFTGLIGRSYIRLESETDPFIRHFIVQACVLVSPICRFVAAPGGFDVYDDPDYGSQDPPLTDAEFATPERAFPQVTFPF